MKKYLFKSLMSNVGFLLACLLSVAASVFAGLVVGTRQGVWWGALIGLGLFLFIALVSVVTAWTWKQTSAKGS